MDQREGDRKVLRVGEHQQEAAEIAAAAARAARPLPPRARCHGDQPERGCAGGPRPPAPRSAHAPRACPARAPPGPQICPAARLGGKKGKIAALFVVGLWKAVPPLFLADSLASRRRGRAAQGAGTQPPRSPTSSECWALGDASRSTGLGRADQALLPLGRLKPSPSLVSPSGVGGRLQGRTALVPLAPALATLAKREAFKTTLRGEGHDDPNFTDERTEPQRSELPFWEPAAWKVAWATLLFLLMESRRVLKHVWGTNHDELSHFTNVETEAQTAAVFSPGLADSPARPSGLA
nr:uncharacterized protein LOC123289509 [Equus asinus]